MSDLRDLYQEVIFDHNRHPRNFRQVEGANRTIEGFNPLCGDRITLYLRVEDNIVQDAGFQGAGCAISTASASLMTEAVRGKTVAEAEALFQDMHQMLAGKGEAESLGKLMVLGGVRAFPTRVKCATLPWHSLHAALTRQSEAVTTE